MKIRNSLTTYYLLFISLLCIFSCKEKKTDSSTVTNGITRIEWIHSTHDFGDLAEGEMVAHTFTFKNTGPHNLIIQNIETGCGCTVVNYDKAPLQPGKEGKIEITFNSAGRYGKQYKEISIFANIPEKLTTLKFTANVK